MQYLAMRSDGTVLAKGDVLVAKWDKSRWTFQSITHPRKVYVTQKKDPNGPDSWPNMANREFYANVFDLGIWDNWDESWSFKPEWG